MKFAAKTMVVDAVSFAVSYGVSEAGEALGLPLPLTLVLSLGADVTMSRQLGKYVFKDSTGKVILESNADEVDKVLKGTGGGKEEIPLYIGGEDVQGGAKNIVGYEKLKKVLGVTEEANPLVDSLKETGKLPENFITKDIAIKNGWRPGKALENFVSGGQIGGDIFSNADDLLPSSFGRQWYEADVGINSTVSRAKQAGSRLLYSNDGLMYITTDHYKTFYFIGKY